MFKKAEKNQSKLRLALDGASGSGKTYSGLVLASSMGKKIAVIDTERGSAALYAGQFDFDVMELTPPYNPERYIEAIKAAVAAGYDVLMIDSLSHEWEGAGGCLDINTSLGGRFQDWAKVTPRHNALIDAMLGCDIHLIATMRTKTEYALEVNGKGKPAPQKIGTAPKQRDGMEYEFTAVLSLNQHHIASASKDRTGLFDGKDFLITPDHGAKLLDWLNSGEAVRSRGEALNEYRTLIQTANTMEELKNAWLAIPKPFHADCEQAKNDKKNELTSTDNQEA